MAQKALTAPTSPGGTLVFGLVSWVLPFLVLEDACLEHMLLQLTTREAGVQEYERLYRLPTT